MRHLLFSALLLVPVLVAACTSSSGPGNDALADGSSDSTTCTGAPPVICDGCCGAKYAADDCQNGVWSCRPRGVFCIACDSGTADSGAGDAGGDAATCTGDQGTACEGCCGIRSNADACVNGVWHCPNFICVVCDAGTTDSAAGDAAGEASTVHDASGDSTTCTGTPPLCFGSNASLCCGNDPSGPAACSGGAWMCGSAPAPGCNGTSCVLQDAGPG
jgi:hypothetical protein